MKRISINLFTPGKDFFFIPLFISLALLECWLNAQSVELFNFKQGIISIATVEKVDINARVKIYYKALFVLSAVFFLTTVACNVLKRRNEKFAKLLEPLNIIAAAGCFLLFFQLTGSGSPFTIDFIWVLMACLVLFGLGIIFLKIEPEYEYSVLLLWMSCFAFTLCFLSVQFILLFFHPVNPPSFKLVYLFSFILVLVSWLLSQRYKVDTRKRIYVLRPLLLLPVLFFFCNELYLAFNQRSIYILSPGKFYLIGLFCVVMSVLWLFKKYREQPVFDIRRSLANFALPLLLVSVTLISSYKTIISPPQEMFELANPANAIMRVYDFGEIPLLQALSSHLLSEQLYSLFYTLINGYDGTMSFFAYEFLHGIIITLLIYFFLYKIFNNAGFAFLFSLFFPFLHIVMDATHAFGFVSVFLLFKLFNEYTFTRLLWLLAWTIFLCGWNLGVGTANFFAVNFIVLLYLALSREKAKVIDYVKAQLYIIVPLLVVVIIIAVINDVNLVVNIKQALSYFGASQAHGYTKLTAAPDRYFQYHYFIFPIIVLAVFFVLLFKIKNLKEQGSFPFIYVSLLFLSMFYFFNAQRGLVRHSFMEGQDMYFSSFIFLIFGLFPAYLYAKNKTLGMFVFVVVCSFAVNNFKLFGSEGYASSFGHLENTYGQPVLSKPSKQKITRVKDAPEFFNDNAAPLKNFMDNNFNKQATFLDFSNTPMLYFYTKRKVPSYFNQYMQNTVTPYLQAQNINYLKTLDVPVVVFSNYPATWWDNTDDVPNRLRYQLTVEYIYENYKPYAAIGKHYLWIDKNINLPLAGDAREDSIFVYGYKKEDIKKLPYVIGTYDKLYASKTLREWNACEVKDSSCSLNLTSLQSVEGNYMRIIISNNNKETSSAMLECSTTVIGGQIIFELLPESTSTYDIPLSWQYNWYRENQHEVKIKFSNPEHIRVNSISLLKKYFPG